VRLKPKLDWDLDVEEEQEKYMSWISKSFWLYVMKMLIPSSTLDYMPMLWNENL